MARKFTNEILIDGRIFVTVTKELGFGAPATLTTVTNETGPGGPLLRPYPNWSWHNSDHMCDGMVNVLRVNVSTNFLHACPFNDFYHISYICL